MIVPFRDAFSFGNIILAKPQLKSGLSRLNIRTAFCPGFLKKSRLTKEIDSFIFQKSKHTDYRHGY
jgi:hypothetical protein